MEIGSINADGSTDLVVSVVGMTSDGMVIIVPGNSDIGIQARWLNKSALPVKDNFKHLKEDQDSPALASVGTYLGMNAIVRSIDHQAITVIWKSLRQGSKWKHCTGSHVVIISSSVLTIQKGSHSVNMVLYVLESRHVGVITTSSLDSSTDEIQTENFLSSCSLKRVLMRLPEIAGRRLDAKEVKSLAHRVPSFTGDVDITNVGKEEECKFPK
jgi:hypothetical protein